VSVENVRGGTTYVGRRLIEMTWQRISESGKRLASAQSETSNTRLSAQYGRGETPIYVTRCGRALKLGPEMRRDSVSGFSCVEGKVTWRQAGWRSGSHFGFQRHHVMGEISVQVEEVTEGSSFRRSETGRPRSSLPAVGRAQRAAYYTAESRLTTAHP